MDILVINGSPKGEKSNTLKITKAFLKGIQNKEQANIDIIDVSKANIEHCKGCFGCWTVTPGKCVIKDDMSIFFEKYISADLVIWSLPLYFFSMPSKVKAFMDRLLPMFLPFIKQREDGGNTHPYRFDSKPADMILISTCGFSSADNNYDALIRQFEIIYGIDFVRIICPEGELFTRQELKNRTSEYLSFVENAGSEYAVGRSFTTLTEKKLNTLLFPQNAYIQMADASWDIKCEKQASTDEEKEKSAALRFTQQMAATYNPSSFDGTQRILEMHYTDVDATYQLMMGKEQCEVKDNEFVKYTTRVETPLTVWQDISQGKYSGEEAMMDGKYRTFGDLKLLISWGRYFGYDSSPNENSSRIINNKPKKRTNMTIMIMTWFVIWTLLSINPIVGGTAGIAVAVGVHFANLKWELTIYDYISCLCVSVFSLLALLGYNMQMIVPLSYLCFGLMWLVSCFTPIPLTAHYSKNNYNGDDAIKNPLFIKTNLILTICWGILYLITPIWTYFIMGSTMPYLTAILNSICPIFLGIFTNWFQKWYPAKVARG
jgi:Multimeric flavodoxin WrbA